MWPHLTTSPSSPPHSASSFERSACVGQVRLRVTHQRCVQQNGHVHQGARSGVPDPPAQCPLIRQQQGAHPAHDPAFEEDPGVVWSNMAGDWLLNIDHIDIKLRPAPAAPQCCRLPCRARDTTVTTVTNPSLTPRVRESGTLRGERTNKTCSCGTPASPKVCGTACPPAVHALAALSDAPACRGPTGTGTRSACGCTRPCDPRWARGARACHNSRRCSPCLACSGAGARTGSGWRVASHANRRGARAAHGAAR